MKKLVSIFSLVIAFTLTAEAQKKKIDKTPKFTIEQNTELAVKQMTLALDLSEKQQSQIRPLFKNQAKKKEAAMNKRTEMRKNRSKPSTDEIYKMKIAFLDNQIAMKNNMKKILNKEQFEKYEKMTANKKKKEKQKMEKIAKMKKRKLLELEEN